MQEKNPAAGSAEMDQSNEGCEVGLFVRYNVRTSNHTLEWHADSFPTIPDGPEEIVIKLCTGRGHDVNGAFKSALGTLVVSALTPSYSDKGKTHG